MKKLIKRIFRGKYYKNGESYVDTIVKVIICVVVGALLLTSVYAVAKSALESAKNKVNGLLDYNPNGEDGPGGGDTSIPDGGDESEPEEPIKPYLTFQSLNPFTISVNSPKWDGTMEYSTDTENWTTWNGLSIPSVDGKVYLRGTGNTRVSSDSSRTYSSFVISGTAVECVGNIETLLNWQAVVDGQHPTMDSYCFYYAFRDCSALITAPDLPATTLAESCYDSMFYGCANLTTAPALPATTLAYRCYYRMFYDCTNLTTAPALPATTLAAECYRNMFYGCTSLTTAPELPATTLATRCYNFMFYNCTNLTTAPELPATTLADFCYSSMFEGCANLTTAPALPATTLANYCYSGMFYGCANLTTAPALPATTLSWGCYYGMFQGCTNLKVSATQTGAYQYEWRIPTEGTISSTPLDWNKDMFASTGGIFTGDPVINTTYYLEYPPVGSEPAIPPVLETPTNISVSGSTLIWDAVANAMSYNVYKDGILFNTVATNSCDISGITEAGSYSFAVQALADGYTPSAISETIAYEVVSEGLTGTKWQMNSSLSDDIVNFAPVYITGIAKSGSYTVNFDIIRAPDYAEYYFAKRSTNESINYQGWTYWYYYKGSGSSHPSVSAPEIEIIGGDDVDNPEFITWLQENATKIS